MAKVNPANKTKTAPATTAKTPEAKAFAETERLAKEAKKEVEKEVKEKAEKKAIVTVNLNPNALSTDVGPAVVKAMAQNYDMEADALAKLNEVESKRYDLLAKTTAAIVKAAKADEQINLSASFSDKKGMILLNSQLFIALGLKAQTSVGKGDKAVTKIDWTPEVAKHFVPKSKDDPNASRVDSFRRNFLTQLKKCAQAAHAIVSRNIEAEIDKTANTLRISGPVVQKTFGAPSVLLNEKQTVGEGDDVKKLNRKPSFTELASMSAAADPAKVGRRGSTPGAGLTKVDPQLALQSMAATMVQAINKLGNAPTLNPDTVKSLTSLASAITNVMKASGNIK